MYSNRQANVPVGLCVRGDVPCPHAPAGYAAYAVQAFKATLPTHALCHDSQFVQHQN